MTSSIELPESLLQAVKRIGADVAAAHAADVDTQARFPSETLAELRRARVLSAPVPAEFGGSGCDMRQLGAMVGTLAQHCASSAMVLAMHYIQLACLVRHHGDGPALVAYLRGLCDKHWLLASMTSENGTFGDTRSSLCAVERTLEPGGERFKLTKDATTGSYCREADAILVTARRAADAAASDQVLVLVRQVDCELTQTTSWDTLGMRGTRSPGFMLVSSGPAGHVLPVPYADISTVSMVPYSHILWSALWTGIAAGAYAKAAAFVRGQARKTPGAVPPTAARLAELSVRLQTMRQQWQALAAEFDDVVARGVDGSALQSMGWALKLNNLKIASSEMAPQIVHGALQIIGILGYKNDSPFSLGRAYRDALSGSLMVSNDRIAAKNASMLLVIKDE